MASKHIFLESYKDYTLYLDNQSNPQSAFFRIRSMQGKWTKTIKDDIEKICGKKIVIKDFVNSNGIGKCIIEIKSNNKKKVKKNS